MTWTLTMTTTAKAKYCKLKHLATTVSLQTCIAFRALEHVDSQSAKIIVTCVGNKSMVCVFCAARLQGSHQKLNSERRLKLIVLPPYRMMTLKKSNPWRRRAPPMTRFTMPLKVLPLNHPGTLARKPLLESLDPLSTIYPVNSTPIQRVTLYLNPADVATYEVDEAPYGYDDVEVPIPAITQVEVHRAAGGARGEATDDYLVPGQDN